MRIWFNTSDLTQRSGPITRIASGLSLACQKYPCTVRVITKSTVCMVQYNWLMTFHYGCKLQASNQSGYCIYSLAKGLTPWRRNHLIVDNYSVCGMGPFQGHSLIQYCVAKGDEYHTATAFYLRTLFKKGMGLTQAAVHHGKNDQSRKTVDTNKQISGQYYQPVDSQESDHVNKVNADVENKAEDIVGDLVVYDDLEKNDSSTSIE
jgi:hypothetical protein